MVMESTAGVLRRLHRLCSQLQPAAASRKKKTIWFIRHGESETNVSEDWTHSDPDLTARGRQQAEGVSADPLLAEALAPRAH